MTSIYVYVYNKYMYVKTKSIYDKEYIDVLYNCMYDIVLIKIVLPSRYNVCMI